MVKFSQNNKISAFSLPELLIVISIIGIIVVFMITLIQPNEHIANMQYKKAYKNLEVAAYNIYEDCNRFDDVNGEVVVGYNADGSEIRVNSCHVDVDAEPGVPAGGGEPATPEEESESGGNYERNITQNANDFCKLLTAYINTAENHCGEANPYFVSSNDMIFTIEDIFDYNDVCHRIVWVDINGANRRPNSREWSRTTPADIVPFSVNDSGEITPLGAPLFDRSYVQAKVVYPDQEETKKSVPMTFGEAQATAFGGNFYKYDSYSYNFSGGIALPESVRATPASQPSGFDPASLYSDKCENNDDDEFPRCTLEII